MLTLLVEDLSMEKYIEMNCEHKAITRLLGLKKKSAAHKANFFSPTFYRDTVKVKRHSGDYLLDILSF